MIWNWIRFILSLLEWSPSGIAAAVVLRQGGKKGSGTLVLQSSRMRGNAEPTEEPLALIARVKRCMAGLVCGDARRGSVVNLSPPVTLHQDLQQSRAVPFPVATLTRSPPCECPF